MNVQELNELMAISSNDAIAYLKETHQQYITKTPEALSTIDIILTKLAIEHLHTPLSDEDLFTICTIFGAFVGELFKENVGGEWYMDTAIEYAPYVVLNYAGKSYPFASICFEKITTTPEVSLAKYYTLACCGGVSLS